MTIHIVSTRLHDFAFEIFERGRNRFSLQTPFEKSEENAPVR